MIPGSEAFCGSWSALLQYLNEQGSVQVCAGIYILSLLIYDTTENGERQPNRGRNRRYDPGEKNSAAMIPEAGITAAALTVKSREKSGKG